MKGEKASEVLQSGIDRVFSWLPYQYPSPDRLNSCKIVAHRGQFDNFKTFENTLAAFDVCQKNKIWGIELDLRWTEDLYPVVLHDPNCGRVFGRPQIVPSRYSFKMLRQHAPFIPSLKEVVDNFGFQCHLMIELKESLSDPDNLKVRRLVEILKGQRPGLDYHFMSFSLEILKRIDFAPSHCILPIADWNIEEMSDEALKRKYGGITGHYFMIKKNHIQSHHRQDQKIGVGFIQSRSSLFRELNRGIDWMFTNKALELKEIIETTSKIEESEN